MAKPIIIAHRGAPTVAPENTAASFMKALEYGAKAVELDVQLTKDGIPVIVHDEKVDRTSNGSGLVRDKTLKELKELDFGSWFSPAFRNERISKLDEVLELFYGKIELFNIEIKNGIVFYPGIEEKVLALLKRYNMLDKTIISSFNHYSLVEVKALEPSVRTGILYMAGLYQPWEYARKVGASAIHPLFYNIVPEIVVGCKSNGLVINPYTVDNPELITRFAKLGVDGIITNVADVALKCLEKIEEVAP